MSILRFAIPLVALTAAASAALKPLEEGFRPAGSRAAVIYKNTPQGDLRINLYFPAEWTASDRRPALVLFFGGGFVRGSPSQFTSTAEYFAGRGLVAATAEYRVRDVHHTPPERCAEDAKSAIRWLRLHAKRLGIDATRVIAGGGSAGATIATYAVYNTTLEADDEDHAVSAKPDALALYNPALGFGDPSRLPAQQKEMAAGPVGRFILNWTVTKGGPPAIVFFGTEDTLLEGGRKFVRQLLDAGTRAELYTAAGQDHGFFNDRPGSPWHALVVRQTDLFLSSLGFLKGEPTFPPPTKGSAVLDKALP